jgi:hypothetical protein
LEFEGCGVEFKSWGWSLWFEVCDLGCGVGVCGSGFWFVVRGLALIIWGLQVVGLRFCVCGIQFCCLGVICG